MATYIELTNQTLRRFGSQTVALANFLTTVDPVVVLAKNAVNDALQEMNFYEYEWPFNNTSADITCVAGTQFYNISTSAKSIDMQSFILNANPTLSVTTTKLTEISYDTWVDRYAERDGNASSSDWDVPDVVFRAPDGSIGFSPIPDQAYTIQYRYYKYVDTLVAATDTPTVPSQFSSVIVAGACKYMAAYRGNTDQQQLYEQQFSKGISRMRTILINDFVRVRDTRINRSGGSRGYLRTA